MSYSAYQSFERQVIKNEVKSVAGPGTSKFLGYEPALRRAGLIKPPPDPRLVHLQQTPRTWRICRYCGGTRSIVKRHITGQFVENRCKHCYNTGGMLFG